MPPSLRSLSAEDVASFHRDGFLPLPALLPESAMAEIDAAFTRVLARVRAVVEDPANAEYITRTIRAGPRGVHVVVPGRDGSRFTFQARDSDAWTSDPPPSPSLSTLSIRHVAWAAKEDPTIAAYGVHPDVLAVAAQLLGGAERIREHGGRLDWIIGAQTHFKEPNDGVRFAWHQDSHHRRMAHGDFVDVNGLGSYVQVIIAVEDTTPDSGPVRFIPKSGANGHIGGLAGLDPAAVDASAAVTPLLRRGDAVALNPYVIHGSDPNTSATWRKTLITGFAFPGAQRNRETVHCEEVPLPEGLE